MTQYNNISKAKIAVIKCILILILLSSSHLSGQNNIIDNYVKNGLDNNLALQQKRATYHKSLEALKEARALFLPDLSFNARYTVADGGRLIDFPIGDMLNGVYSSLNILTSIHNLTDPGTGEPMNFPQLENLNFRFFRPREHETKLRLLQPIINSQIYYNSKIKSELTKVEKADLETFRRTLVAEIKTAYFNYLKTEKLNQLLINTKELVLENIRVNESLYKNHKITLDILFRSKSELSKLEQQIAEANKSNKTARAYFNFLLNRDFNSEIIITGNIITGLNISNINTSEQNAIRMREELSGLRSYSRIADNTIKLNKSNKLPNLTAAIDYGFQGEKYRFQNDDDFIMASLVLKWDLFKGYSNKAKISQSILDKIMIDNKQKEVENQIKLEVINSYYELEAAGKSIIAAEQQKLSAEKAFNMVKKKYQEGQSNLLQFLDARTNHTNSSANLIITKYDYLIKYAEYEKVTALYDISE